MSVFDQLNNAGTAMRERIALAQKTLLNDDIDPRSEDRVAAKCWLTYRVTDGTIEVEHWPAIRCIEPTYRNDDGLELRWRISQLTAEMYLYGLTIGDEAALKAVLYLIGWEQYRLHQWPACILNYLRAMCASALLDPAMAHRIVGDAIRCWQMQMGSMKWQQHPMRLVELRDDLSALWQLLAIGRQCGAVQYKDYAWLPKFCGGNDLFAQLMRKLKAPAL